MIEVLIAVAGILVAFWMIRSARHRHRGSRDNGTS
jgi:hypothetical protein